jgi:hypothetical protein
MCRNVMYLMYLTPACRLCLGIMLEALIPVCSGPVP